MRLEGRIMNPSLLAQKAFNLFLTPPSPKSRDKGRNTLRDSHRNNVKGISSRLRERSRGGTKTFLLVRESQTELTELADENVERCSMRLHYFCHGAHSLNGSIIDIERELTKQTRSNDSISSLDEKHAMFDRCRHREAQTKPDSQPSISRTRAKV